MVLRPIVILTLSTTCIPLHISLKPKPPIFLKNNGWVHDIVALINDVVSRGINTRPHYRDNIEQLAEQKTV